MINKSVLKFGGSSVKDALSMRRCCEIIANHPSVKVVVVSATQNTTNQLEELFRLGKSSNKAQAFSLLKEIRTRHSDIAGELGVFKSCDNPIREIYMQARGVVEKLILGVNDSRETMDSLYSVGERLSSLIMGQYLDATLESNVKVWDARSIIKTNSDFSKASPLLKESKKAGEYLKKFIEKENTIAITQGFIGSTLNAKATTLGREGSDYSAALIGEIIEADDVYILTDVMGIATSDPRIVQNVNYLKSISYNGATVMAEKGAKVLFPRTLAPAKRSGMQVYVGSSQDGVLKGTCIEQISYDSPQLFAVTMDDFAQDEEKIISVIGYDLFNYPIELDFSFLSTRFELWEQTSDCFAIKVANDDALKAINEVHDKLFL